VKQLINHIALVSIIARARVRIEKETVWPAAVALVALLLSACAAPRTQVAQTVVGEKTATVQLADLGEKISSIQVKRLNEANGASEILVVKGSDAVITRSNGLKKSLNIGDQAFATISENILTLKAVPAGQKNSDSMRIYFTIAGTQGVKEFEMDPSSKMMPVYADLMNIRNQVLSDGK
jgi:hypothetical protein